MCYLMTKGQINDLWSLKLQNVLALCLCQTKYSIIQIFKYRSKEATVQRWMFYFTTISKRSTTENKVSSVAYFMTNECGEIKTFSKKTVIFSTLSLAALYVPHATFTTCIKKQAYYWNETSQQLVISILCWVYFCYKI